MKKTILFFALSTVIFAANAQTPVAVDPHAGHNHAKEAVATPKKAVGVAAVTSNTAPASVVATTAVEAPVLVDALAVKETEYDFGKIPQGKPVTHVFTVTNSGKTPYKLDNVTASCGCTTPEWDREKTIEPGTSANITVGFNAGAAGPFTKPVTITYNGTQSKMLNIKGEVYTTPATPAPVNAEVMEIKK